MLLARTATTMVELVLVLFALERFHSAGLAGAVTFLALAPGLLMSPIAGALLDRHGRVKLMVVDYVVAAVALALIVGLGATDLLSEVPLLVIVTVMSSPGRTVQALSPTQPEVIGVSLAGRISYHA